MRASIAGYLLIAAGLAGASASRADDKVACVQAADAAQDQRSAGKLREARASFQACARETCPPLVRSDCTRWQAEVEAAMPTIVLRAMGPRGEDLTEVQVELDGRRIADKLEGLPLEVDPGAHVITGRTAAGPVSRQEIVIRTAEKNRTVILRVESRDALRSPTEASPPSPIGAETSFRPGAGAWIAAGVAAAGATSFAYFGLRGRAEVDDMRDECEGHCAASRVDAARQKLLIADLSLGVALISAGIATYLFVRAAPSAAKPALAREITVMPLTGGVGAAFIERF
jgi:hypothetical protein